MLHSALRLRSAGMLYQGDIETLWDLVQKLLVDADVEVSLTVMLWVNKTT